MTEPKAYSWAIEGDSLAVKIVVPIHADGSVDGSVVYSIPMGRALAMISIAVAGLDGTGEILDSALREGADVERIRREAFMEAGAIARAFPREPGADVAVIVARIAQALETIAGKGTWPNAPTSPRSGRQ